MQTIRFLTSRLDQPFGSAAGSRTFLAIALVIIASVARAANPAGHTKIVLDGTTTADGPFQVTNQPRMVTTSGVAIFDGSTNYGSLSGLFAGNATTWGAVVKKGGAAPGGPLFYSFDINSLFGGDMACNRAGDMAFFADTRPAGSYTSTSGLFLRTSAGLYQLAVVGGSAPGGGSFNSLGGMPSISTDGRVSFVTTTLGGGGKGVYYARVVSGTPVLQSVAVLGGAAPDGGTFNSFGQSGVNPSGNVVFSAATTTNGSTRLYWWNGTAVSVIPGSSSGAFMLNDAGQLMFVGGWSGSGGASVLLSLGTVAAPQPILRVGDAAPGGGTFSSVSSAVLNESGQIAFFGTSSVGGGAYLWTPSGIKLIAAAGVAPGGGTFTMDFFSGTFSGTPSVNKNGVVAFRNITSGGSAIFMGDGTTLSRVIGAGDTLEGQQVQDVAFGLGWGFSGFPSRYVAGQEAINEFNQLAYSANLKSTSGSTSNGIFLYTQPAPKIDVQQPAGVSLTSGSSTVNFGTPVLGSTIDRTFTVQNLGNLGLNLGTLSFTGADAADFSILPGLFLPMAPGGTSTFVVRCAPSATGARNATLHVESSDTLRSPFDIAVTATGTQPAQIASPAAGSVFATASVTFTWDTGFGASSYALWVGSTLGGNDVYAGNEGTNHTKTVTVPDDGRTLYVTLYSFISGAWQNNKYTYTAWRAPTPVKARITSPVNGSTLASTSLPLVWDLGVGVTSCYLFVGTAPGGADIYAGDQGTATSRTVTVPADRRIHVTLWSLIKGAYKANYYSFNSVPAVRAALTSPADGSTLTGGTLDLVWSAGVGASKYLVWLGSSPGGYDLGTADAGTATLKTLTVIRDGGPVYVTLWSLINGGWQGSSYWFTTALPASGNRPARLTSPANASTLSSSALNLAWDSGVGASSYALWVGSSPDGYDLYAGLEGGSLSKSSIVVPGDGRRIYVTLHTLISGAYQSNSYFFIAPTLPDGGAAQITAPAGGSTLADSNLPLTWSSAAGVTQYYLFVGGSPGASDLYSGSQGVSLSRTVTGLPVDGRPVYVTLYSWINNAWRTTSATYTTANTASGNKRALITSPANGGTLSGAGTTFNWGGGSGVTSYALWIGSSPGAYDLWSSAESAGTLSRTVTLPTDGRKVYTTLYSQIGGVWQGASYLYTAANVAVTKAAITSPASGTTLPGASATFTWSTSNSATSYALWIGRTPGGYDVYAGAEGTGTSRTVSTLPVDGGPVYVTIWSFIKGSWQSNEAVYQAATP